MIDFQNKASNFNKILVRTFQDQNLVLYLATPKSAHANLLASANANARITDYSLSIGKVLTVLQVDQYISALTYLNVGPSAVRDLVH